jgi:hypothetical protein
MLLHLKATSCVREHFTDGDGLLLVVAEEIIHSRVVLIDVAILRRQFLAFLAKLCRGRWTAWS